MLPNDAPKEYRYPGQKERFRDSPADQDYEDMLGHSALNVNIGDWFEMTQESVLTPEQRAQRDAIPCSMEEMMRGPPVPYMSTPGLRKSGGRDQESGVEDVAREGEDEPSPPMLEDEPSPPMAIGGLGANLPKPPPADQPPPHQPPTNRPRTPRCTKREHRRRRESIALLLQESASNAQIIRTCQQAYGIKRRMAQIYLKQVREQLARDAGKADHLAHLQLSKLQQDRLLQRTLRDLDKIEDPTKSATLLRTGLAIIKNRDQTMEEIRHHRAITRRDESPDSKMQKKLRQRMIYMPFDELLERQENMRNRWFHEWNQCRISEKMREGTLGPGYIESPYEAAVSDPWCKPQPTLGPPGTEWSI